MSEHPKTVFDLCGTTDWESNYYFKLKGGRTLYESAVYTDRADKVIISRVCKTGETAGKPFLLGLNQVLRYVNPETEIELVAIIKG